MQYHYFYEQLLEANIDIDDVSEIGVPVRELLLMMRDGLVQYTPGETAGKGKKTYLGRPIIKTDSVRYYLTADGKKVEF